MKRALDRLALLAGAVIFLWALAGCNNSFTVTLDKSSYTAGDNGTATLSIRALQQHICRAAASFPTKSWLTANGQTMGPLWSVCGRVMWCRLLQEALTSRRLLQKTPVPGGSGIWLRSAALKVNP
jgi:hypothetical protein